MSGFGSPVAQGSNPVGTGLSTLSDLMNVKRSQQALQTGVYQQQTAAAQAQQEGLKAQQQQGVQNFFQTWDPSEHVGQDGTTDLDSALQSDAFKGSGNAKPAVMQALLDIKNKQLSNKQALTTLNGDLIKQFGTGIGALAQDDDVKADTTDPVTGVNAGRAKVNEFLGNFSKLSPDAARVAQIYGPITQHAPPGKLAQGVGALQLQALDAGQERGQIYGTPTNIDTGGTVQPGTQAPASAGGGFTPSGPGIPKTLSPTDQPDYKRKAAEAAAAGGARGAGTANADVDRANQVSASVKAAPSGIQTTQQVDDLADQIHSGKFAAWVSQKAAAVGMNESTYARQLLEKDLGIVKTQLTSAAPSDSRAATILSGTPEATSDPQTIHGAMDYVRGSFRQNLAQGQNLAAYRGKHPDLSGFQSADDTFTGAGGPLAHEFLSLKDKGSQAAFYRRNFSSREQAELFRNQTRATAHVLGLDNANQ